MELSIERWPAICRRDGLDVFERGSERAGYLWRARSHQSDLVKGEPYVALPVEHRDHQAQLSLGVVVVPVGQLAGGQQPHAVVDSV